MVADTAAQGCSRSVGTAAQETAKKSLRYRRPGPPDSLVGGLTIPLRFIGEVRTNEYRM